MNICIVGVGNIGMRYVQGISRTFPDARLFLVDNDTRIEELKQARPDNATLLTSLDDVDNAVDLFVVSTSCDPRLAIYKQCLAFNPRYIILEKYLFKSREEFELCLALDRVPTFVNQWLYGSGTFDCLFNQASMSVAVTGSGWGLACNAVHWMDMLKRQLRISHLQVGSDSFVSDIFPSKRPGYEEISGELIFVDADSDKTIRLIDRQDDSLIDKMTIRVDETVYDFDYATIKKDDKVLSRFPYFSELVGDIVYDIMNKGSCSLPDLDESIAQHLLIEDIFAKLDHRPMIT